MSEYVRRCGLIRSGGSFVPMRNDRSGGSVRFGPAGRSFRPGTIVPADRSAPIFKKSIGFHEPIFLIETFNHFRFHLHAHDAVSYCHDLLAASATLVLAAAGSI